MNVTAFNSRQLLLNKMQKRALKKLNSMIAYKQNYIIEQFVGNNAKGRISKRVFQESKARQNFRKNKQTFRKFGSKKQRVYTKDFLSA